MSGSLAGTYGYKVDRDPCPKNVSIVGSAGVDVSGLRKTFLFLSHKAGMRCTMYVLGFPCVLYHVLALVLVWWHCRACSSGITPSRHIYSHMSCMQCGDLLWTSMHALPGLDFGSKAAILPLPLSFGIHHIGPRAENGAILLFDLLFTSRFSSLASTMVTKSGAIYELNTWLLFQVRRTRAGWVRSQVNHTFHVYNWPWDWTTKNGYKKTKTSCLRAISLGYLEDFVCDSLGS